MRIAALAVVCAVALMGCFGGDKESPEGQPDYLERVLEIVNESNASARSWACLSDQDNFRSCDREALRNALVRTAERWEALEAPAELRPYEAALLDTYRDIIAFVAVPTEEVDDRAREFPGLVLAEDRWEAWGEAVEHYYEVRLYRFEGRSIEPAFCHKDAVAITPRPPLITRWQIVLFDLPLGREREFIKRVVGLPGETIEVRDGTIFIDGTPVEGDVYALAPPNYTVEPLTIPADRYYVLGDNRRNSYDSHQWASAAGEPREVGSTVPYDHIIGVLPADHRTCFEPS